LGAENTWGRVPPVCPAKDEGELLGYRGDGKKKGEKRGKAVLTADEEGKKKAIARVKKTKKCRPRCRHRLEHNAAFIIWKKLAISEAKKYKKRGELRRSPTSSQSEDP